MTYVMLIAVLILIAIVGFGIGQHVHRLKQYQHKQKSDEQLYRRVLNNIDERLSIEEAKEQFSLSAYSSLLRRIQETTHFPLTQNDRVQLLLNGEEKYAALFQAIEKAEHHIHILYYIIRNDRIGQQFLELLKQKARDQVEVRLLVDGLGSRQLDTSVYEDLRHAGVECATFSPAKLHFLWHLNFRNHRKIVVIDGRIGFTGGLNVGDEYLHRDPQKGFWRDTHMLIEGESVLLLQRIFATDWYYTTQKKVTADDQYFPQFTEKGTKQKQGETALAQVVPSGPDMPQQVVPKTLQSMILSAREKIWLTTPYFIPDPTFMTAIKRARGKGIEVKLIVPKKTDSSLVHYASYHYLKQLLEHGVQIFQYEQGFYHAKTALVDDHMANIGSVNLDRRSFFYSFEAGIFVYHRETAAQLATVLEEDMQACTPLTLEKIEQRNVLNKAATQFSLLLVPWL